MKPAPVRSLMFLAAAALAACGPDSGATRASTAVIASDGTGSVTLGGVAITVDPGVRFVQHVTSTVTGGSMTSTSTTTLAGHPFGISGGRFSIGPSDYGPVTEGDRVHVTPGGVFVDGQRRGDLPAPLEP